MLTKRFSPNQATRGLLLFTLSAAAWVPQAMAADEAAAKADDGHQYHHLEAISVTASGQTLDEVVQPTKVMTGAELRQAAGSSLGGVLENMPGIANASFGPGVGRPVIRGLSGNRVKIAVNGNDAADVSAMSNDHAPMADVANAEQIEVIYGPSTLLFGSGAIGGVINVADKRFHDMPLWQGQGVIDAEVHLTTSSVDQGQQVSAQVDAGVAPNWVVHVDGFQRSAENYHSQKGEVKNTQTSAQGASLGVTHIHDSGRAGVAVSVLEYDYGVPNADDEDASVAPSQVRVDALFEKIFSSQYVDALTTQLSVNDYEHDELDEDSVVGFFEKENTEFKSVLSLREWAGINSKVGVHVNAQRLALCHDHSGCEDGVPDYSHLSWDGSKGGNFDPVTDANGKVIEFAHDTPMPITETLDTSVFGLVSRDWSVGQHNGKQEYALRIDQRVLQADPDSVRPASRQAQSYYDDRHFTSVTASAGWTWLRDNHKWGVAVAHAQRAPQADEMYWNGDHHATFSYQLDNPDLEIETAHALDITFQYFDRQQQWDIAAYYYDFDGYIYNELQSIKDPYHGNDVYQFVQKDAYLTGFEAAWLYQLNTQLAFNAVTDKTIGRLKQSVNGEKNLPRIPPQTLLLGLNWQQGHWLLKTDVKYFAEQDQVAANETKTADYVTLNALVAYELEWQRTHFDISLKGQNLTDAFGRNHVSYLKAYSPIAGRNLVLDLSVVF